MVKTVEQMLKGNAAEIARLTGYPHSTILNWQKNPDALPLTKAIIIANALELSNEEWGALRGKRC